ncbi:DUF898 family protein [Tenacibaculum sp. TC6]|uniref:DUF898 family protein n=1 Tax=Tenacibaculum sp. TC6 TaxID=3423223 RepID=UPI003D369812
MTNDFTFAVLFFKNFLLIIITLGFYYPWAKTELIKYYTKVTFFNNSNFKFSGNPREIFKSYIIIVLFFIPYTFLITSITSKNSLFQIITLSAFYLTSLILIPLIIHGFVQCRTSNTHWKGVYFKYLGDKFEFLWKYLTGIILTIFTLEIYSSWFQVDLQKYIISHLRFGNLSFNFTRKGDTLFLINLKFLLLFPITLGIYTFWYFKNLLEFYIDSIEVTQDGKQTSLKITLQIGDVFQLMTTNFLLIILTLGIATPWVIVRTYTFIFNFLEIAPDLNVNAIQQTNYNNNTNQGFLDLDLV